MQQQIPPIDFTQIGKQSTLLLEGFMRQRGDDMAESMQPIVNSFSALAHNMLQDPQRLMEAQLELYQSYLNLWAHMAEKAMGKESVPIVTPAKGDKRFTHKDWEENLIFDFIKQSYLLSANWAAQNVAKTNGLDEQTKRKAQFYVQQYLDALAPSNFAITNPAVLETTLETQGQNLINGLKNILTDMQRGGISMTDYDAFEVGKNIAITKGNVVHRGKLFELIQYSPTTAKVYEKPILISPPWINRFYILDLRPENSFVKFAVDHGLQVFMISWKNPDESYKDVSFEDYLKEGIHEALEHTLAITKQDSANMIGYCIGGTLLGAALAHAVKAKDKRINSATFFTTLMDFSNAGELEVFLDEEQVSALEKKMNARGYLDGKEMAATFSMLRSNDLIWSFVVNNYLLGKDPFPFDILYWNDDPTRMPAAMHSYYLRNMYLENNLAKANKLELLGEKLDISKIAVPMYMVTGLNDHITPWQSCYAPFQKMASKDKRLILSKAGHVAGVVNPPTPKGKPIKRSYWAGEPNTTQAEKWLESATKFEDSWWPDWANWVQSRSGQQVKAPKSAGDNKHKPLCPAPGTYVNERD